MPNRYLFEDDNKIKTFANGSLQEIGNAPVTESMFNSAFSDLNVITSTVINTFSSNNPKLLAVSNSVSLQTKLTVTPKPQLIKATGDINLDKVENVDYIQIVATQSANAIIKIIASTDLGASWKTFYNNGWVTIDSNDLNAIKNLGISIPSFNTMNSSHWFSLINNSKKIRFAYYLEIEDSTDIAFTDSLSSKFDMNGIWKGAVYGTDFDYDYPSNSLVRIKIYSNGDYKINY